MTLREVFKVAIQIFCAYQIIAFFGDLHIIISRGIVQSSVFAIHNTISIVFGCIIFPYIFINAEKYSQFAIQTDINISDFIENIGKTYTLRVVLFLEGLILIILEMIMILQQIYHNVVPIDIEGQVISNGQIFSIGNALVLGIGIIFIIMSKKLELDHLGNIKYHYSTGSIFYTVLISIILVNILLKCLNFVEILAFKDTLNIAPLALLFPIFSIIYFAIIARLLKFLCEFFLKESVNLLKSFFLLTIIINTLLIIPNIVSRLNVNDLPVSLPFIYILFIQLLPFLILIISALGKKKHFIDK